MKAILLIWLYALAITSLLAQPYQPEPLRVIFDTDMGSDCDDAGALALLHHYAAQGRVNILATTYTSGKVPYGAAVVEAINTYYGQPNIPVAAMHDTTFGDPEDKMLAEKLARDTAAFHHNIIHNHDALEHVSLCRKVLAQQPDTSVVYLTVGHTKGLYDLLKSAPDNYSALKGKDLLRKKMKRWVALGALGASNDEGHYTRDWNFFFNGTAPYTEYLVSNFPRPVHYVDGGRNVMTGKGLKQTPPGNIVRTAYRDWLWYVENKSLDEQRPSWDLVTVYYAVEGIGSYFKNPKMGWLDFDEEKGCFWREGHQGPEQYFVLQKQGTDEDFARYLNLILSREASLHKLDSY